MALIPGVSLQQGVTDAAGHLVADLSANGGANQLLLDPVSYQPTGLRAVFPIQKAAKPSPAKGGHSGVPGKGTALDSLAYVTVKEVSKPGAR